MDYLPIHLDLKAKQTLIVGGAEAALRKAELLLAAGANVRVVAPEVCAEIAALASAGRLVHIARIFSSTDLAGISLVIGAAEPDVDLAALATAARVAGVPVNIVDHPALSTFIMPAIVDRGLITVGISSSGASPVLARRIRELIERLLPARLGDLARFAKDFRTAVRSVIPDFSRRRHFWEQFFDSSVAETVLSGDERRAREQMLALINRAGRDDNAPGAISIVGAGPGDPDLLTVRAVRLLQQADVILHDELVAPKILELARRDARLINVGKQAGRPSMAQMRINELMVEEARQGQHVLRLKGGDPFIFGRGGEELDHARREGFEPLVVPGITAAIGCAAAAGIPLTHRDLASGVSFVTGHAKSGAPIADWAALGASGQTIVIYMGLTYAGMIGQKLIEGGLSRSTPVALIENGTRPEQRVSTGYLADLSLLAARHGSEGPVLLIVGEVAAAARDQGLAMDTAATAS